MPRLRDALRTKSSLSVTVAVRSYVNGVATVTA
jgi:hypothetical protein